MTRAPARVTSPSSIRSGHRGTHLVALRLQDAPLRGAPALELDRRAAGGRPLRGEGHPVLGHLGGQAVDEGSRLGGGGRRLRPGPEDRLGAVERAPQRALHDALHRPDQIGQLVPQEEDVLDGRPVETRPQRGREDRRGRGRGGRPRPASAGPGPGGRGATAAPPRRSAGGRRPEKGGSGYRSPKVSQTTSEPVRQSVPTGRSTGMRYQSSPATRANSTSRSRARSMGPACTAPKSTRASSNSHHREAGIPG